MRQHLYISLPAVRGELTPLLLSIRVYGRVGLKCLWLSLSLPPEELLIGIILNNDKRQGIALFILSKWQLDINHFHVQSGEQKCTNDTICAEKSVRKNTFRHSQSPKNRLFRPLPIPHLCPEEPVYVSPCIRGRSQKKVIRAADERMSLRTQTFASGVANVCIRGCKYLHLEVQPYLFTI